MAELAVVRSIDGPMAVESVISDIRKSIVSGDVPPGRALSLKEIASDRRVRLPTLMSLARRLERDRLVTLRGDVALVTDLDPDEVFSSFRMRRLIASELMPRAAELASPAKIKEIEQAIAPGAQRVPLTYREAREQYYDLLIKLLEPATTNWDLRILRNAWDTGLRYERYGHGAFDAGWSGPFTNSKEAGRYFVEQIRDIADLYRARKISAIRARVAGLVDEGSEVAGQSLDVDLDKVQRTSPWLVP